MHYVVQQHVFKEHNYNIIFEALERLGLPFEVVEYKDGKFDFKTDRKDVFPFGSIRLANLSTQQDWHPGSFYGGNHDFMVYKDHYKDNLLNYDSHIQKLNEPIEWFGNEM